MADISFPCNIPGALVVANASRLESVVRRNDLSSGPPLFILEDDDKYQTFSVTWSFSAVEKQVFDNWFKYSTLSGSKLFNIELMIDGAEGGKNTKTHECYFDGTYQVSQTSKRWRISATLISIEQQILDECLGPSLVAIHDGFDYPIFQDAIDDVNDIILLFEELWLP